MLLVAMPVAGYLLVHTVRASVTAAFDARLESYLNTVTASMTTNQLGLLDFDDHLGDPLFQQIYSGWYWQISDAETILFGSRSLWDASLDLPETAASGLVIRPGPQGQTLRVMYRTVRRPEREEPLVVAVAGSNSEIRTELNKFEVVISGSLAAFGLGLMLLIALQVHWSLRPLRWLYRRVQRLRPGETLNSEVTLPKELEELSGAISQALKRNEQLLEHSRMTAGNLAHSLKTPLSVLQVQLENAESLEPELLRSELQRIDAAIQHHLARASAAGRHRLSNSYRVAPIVDPILKGLRVLADRHSKRLNVVMDDQAELNMDPQDLQELVGNLVENAIKYAKSEVFFECDSSHMRVADDGSGLTDSQYTQARQRGGRLDQQAEGFGLGLAIVDEIAHLYQLDITFGRAKSGGLEVTIIFPAEV